MSDFGLSWRWNLTASVLISRRKNYLCSIFDAPKKFSVLIHLAIRSQFELLQTKCRLKMKFFYTHKKIFFWAWPKTFRRQFFSCSRDRNECDVTGVAVCWGPLEIEIFTPRWMTLWVKGHLPWDSFHESKLDIKVVSRPPTSLMARFYRINKWRETVFRTFRWKSGSLGEINKGKSLNIFH